MFWPELIFVTNITNYISGEKIAMWRNFSFPCMTIVGKLKISPPVEKFGNFWEILRNFGKFCHNLRAFMWRKIEPKSTFVEKQFQENSLKLNSHWQLLTACYLGGSQNDGNQANALKMCVNGNTITTFQVEYPWLTQQRKLCKVVSGMSAWNVLKLFSL